MKSKIQINRKIIHSAFTFMNSRNDDDKLSIHFADRNSDDSVSFLLDQEEAEKLRKHLGYFIKN